MAGTDSVAGQKFMTHRNPRAQGNDVRSQLTWEKGWTRINRQLHT